LALDNYYWTTCAINDKVLAVDFYIAIVLICLMGAFLLSAAETVLTSLGRLESEKIISAGGRPARHVEKWVADPNRMLISVLIMNNAATIIASSVFALWLHERYPQWITAFMGLLTFVLIVFAEIVPKLIARMYSITLAPSAAQFLNLLADVLTPVIFLIQKLTNRLVIGSGMPGRMVHAPMTEEELTHTIEIAAKEGGIDRETGQVLSNLIDFPDRRARDIMTTRAKIQAISIGWTQEEVARYVAADGHSRYPVYRGTLEDIVGFLLVKDFLSHVYKIAPGNWTRSIRRAYFVTEMAPAGRIMKDMRRWGTHLALVRNEMGALTGLITLEDLIEEIVGEIQDEHDDPTNSSIIETGDGNRIVRGDIPIVEFNFRFSRNLPIDVDYSTLNGYILKKTGGQAPVVNTLIFDDEVTFKIHSIEDNGVMTFELIEPS
jgi:putative hemolysin